MPPSTDFVVAVWGRDFSPEVHAEVVAAAAEAGFAPTVDVFLPVCREDIALLKNTWKYVKALDYPRSFEVHVLDDGAQDDVRDLAEAFGFRCECVVADGDAVVGGGGGVVGVIVRGGGGGVWNGGSFCCSAWEMERRT